jgi:hypothetical protein
VSFWKCQIPCRERNKYIRVKGNDAEPGACRVDPDCFGCELKTGSCTLVFERTHNLVSLFRVPHKGLSYKKDNRRREKRVPHNVMAELVLN